MKSGNSIWLISVTCDWSLLLYFSVASDWYSGWVVFRKRKQRTPERQSVPSTQYQRLFKTRNRLFRLICTSSACTCCQKGPLPCAPLPAAPFVALFSIQFEEFIHQIDLTCTLHPGILPRRGYMIEMIRLVRIGPYEIN